MNLKEQNLKTIENFQKEMITLGRIGALLNWDNQTYMPKEAGEERAEQLSYISVLIHEKMTDEKLWQAVSSLHKNTNDLDQNQKRMINLLYKETEKSKKLPKEFIAEISKEKGLSFNAWQKAREKNNKDLFLPHLKKIVELKIKEIEYRGYNNHPYNTFLDDYEEDMTVEKLDPIFEKLKIGLIKLLKKIKESDYYKKQEKKITTKAFDKDKQIEFTKLISEKLGLKKESSRIDLSEHPFTTTLGIKDVRITTNVRKDPLFSIGSTIHEAGHALYELGMPNDSNEQFTVLRDSPSLGMHESQSRFWENMIGLNKPFWEYFFPKAKELFSIEENIENWINEINQVNPNLIRIESDEVHYCLHVILRYELEKGLMDGSIKVEDIPTIWNQKIKEYFDIEVTKDKEGFMQDVHWSEGYFGYFPTYAIGTIYASQIYEELLNQFPNIEEEIAKGNLEKITNWLKENIHKIGSKKKTQDIIKDLCKDELNADKFLDYLNKKYGEIYNL